MAAPVRNILDIPSYTDAKTGQLEKRVNTGYIKEKIQDSVSGNEI
jgi:hypothetical protein